METTFDLCVGCIVGRPDGSDLFCDSCRQAQADRLERVLGARVRDLVDTGAGPLVVLQRSWPVGTTVEQVLADELPADSVILTGDGRGYRAEPHDGPVPPIEEWVRVERWSPRGQEFHGFISATSRRIVQWG